MTVSTTRSPSRGLSSTSAGSVPRRGSGYQTARTWPLSGSSAARPRAAAGSERIAVTLVGGPFAREHRLGPAGEVDVEVLADVDDELAAVEVDRDRRVASAQHVGHGGPDRPGPRAQGLSRPALEDPGADRAGSPLGPERDVGAVGKARVDLDRRADRRQGERGERRLGGNADRELRGADRDFLAAGPGGLRRLADPRAAHVNPAGALVDDRRADLAGDRLHGELLSIGPAAAVQVHDPLAHAVAGQLRLRAVGVEDPQARHEAGLVGLLDGDDAVGADAAMAVADQAHRVGVHGLGDDHVVVAQRLPLLEPHGAGESMRAATSSGDRPVTSMSCAPRSLRSQVSCRRAYWRVRVFIASMSPASNSEKPSACRAVREARAASARRTSSAAPAATMAFTRTSIAAFRSSRSITSATSFVGTRVCVAHRSSSAGGYSKPWSSSASERARRRGSAGSSRSARWGARRPSSAWRSAAPRASSAA